MSETDRVKKVTSVLEVALSSSRISFTEAEFVLDSL